MCQLQKGGGEGKSPENGTETFCLIEKGERYLHLQEKIASSEEKFDARLNDMCVVEGKKAVKKWREDVRGRGVVC